MVLSLCHEMFYKIIGDDDWRGDRPFHSPGYDTTNVLVITNRNLKHEVPLIHLSVPGGGVRSQNLFKKR